MLRFATLLLTMLGLAGGCGTETTAAREQALTGHIDQGTFPYTVGSVDVVDGAGAVATVPVDASGAFRVVLPVGGRYQVRVAGGQADATVVFPRASGKLDAWLPIDHAGAAFDVGAVRFLGAVPAAGFKLTSANNAQAGDPAGAEDGECEDGIDPATGAVCVDDDAEDGCDGEGEGDGDGEEADGEEADGEDAGDVDDIECEDGIDPNTGAACEDGGDEEDDAVDGDVAVAEHNPPAGGMCGGDEEEDDGVDCQQEGEHEGEDEGC